MLYLVSPGYAFEACLQGGFRVFDWHGGWEEGKGGGGGVEW